MMKGKKDSVLFRLGMNTSGEKEKKEGGGGATDTKRQSLPVLFF